MQNRKTLNFRTFVVNFACYFFLSSEFAAGICEFRFSNGPYRREVSLTGVGLALPRCENDFTSLIPRCNIGEIYRISRHTIIIIEDERIFPRWYSGSCCKQMKVEVGYSVLISQAVTRSTFLRNHFVCCWLHDSRSACCNARPWRYTAGQASSNIPSSSQQSKHWQTIESR